MHPTLLQSTPAPFNASTLYEYIMAGGPFMVPLGICSVLALGFMVERTIRLRRGRLGTRSFGDQLVAAAQGGGAASALQLCEQNRSSMARVIGAGLKRANATPAEVEKAVEDAGHREVKNLAANLKPLEVLAVLSPLLGLLGTVVGMILAFSGLALKQGRGNPELLASGISHALVTTASGLLIAVASQAVYYIFRSKIERFVRSTEDVYARVSDTLYARAGAAHANP